MEHYEFTIAQPKQPKMKIKTTCERVQPVAKGIDKNGQIIWEGHAMPYWQMVMFKAERYYGDFVAHWSKVRFFVHTWHEGENTISADFKAHVPEQVKKPWKYQGD